MRLYQRENNIWYIEFKRGSAKSLRTRDKTLANRLYNQIKKEILLGKIIQLDRHHYLNLEDFMNKYIDYRSKIKAENTVMIDKNSLRKLIEYSGNINIQSITRKRIDDFIGFLKLNKYRPVSINIYIRHLKTAFNKAIEWGYIKKSHMKFIKQIPIQDNLPSALTSEEVYNLLNIIDKQEFKEYTLACLYTGGRRTEIAKLEWQNIKRYKDTWYVKIKVSKTRSKVIPLSDRLEKILFYRKKDIGAIFPYYYRHPKEASKHFRKYADKTGIKNKLHDLRHTCATFMIMNGINIRVVQEILGHSSVKTTEIYTKLTAENLKGAMNVLHF